MTFEIIFIAIGLAVICLGSHLYRSLTMNSHKDTVIPSDEVTPRKAVKSLPVMIEEDNGEDPSDSAELSPLESACIASDPDVSEISIEEDNIIHELTELGYRVEKAASSNKALEENTVIDAFDDGRCFFPAPETSGLGDDFTPVENQ